MSVMVLTACSKKAERPAPQTFPVTGKVVPNGGPLPVGGCVVFESNTNAAEFTAVGLILDDGSFKLTIPYVDRVLTGATAGPHSVRVLLPIEPSLGGGKPVSINGSFTVQPNENHFTIVMPPGNKSAAGDLP